MTNKQFGWTYAAYGSAEGGVQPETANTPRFRNHENWAVSRGTNSALTRSASGRRQARDARRLLLRGHGRQ